LGLSRVRSRLCFVSPWAENGHIIKYLRHNPTADRLLLCLDVAAGIEYLHQNTTIHGDLKGANILVNDAARACVADFGLSYVNDSQILHWTSQSSAASKGGTTRWQAPELLEGAGLVHNTPASDMYALACVYYEIFTGAIPFFDCPRESTVIAKVKEGGRPTCPSKVDTPWTEWGLTDDMWSLMQECWQHDPVARPKIGQIVQRLSEWVTVDIRPVQLAAWTDSVIRVHDTNDTFLALSVINGILDSGTTEPETYATVLQEFFFGENPVKMNRRLKRGMACVSVALLIILIVIIVIFKIKGGY